MSTGERIKKIRKEKGLSTYDISKMTGISQSAVSKLENGKRKADILVLEKMADALQTPLSHLLSSCDIPMEAERKGVLKMTIPTMYTLTQASKATGLSYDHLRNLCLQKKIVHVRSGKKYLVNMEKLVDYLNGEEG